MNSVMLHLWHISTPKWYTGDNLCIVHFLVHFRLEVTCWWWEIFGCLRRFLCWIIKYIRKFCETKQLPAAVKVSRWWWHCHGRRTTPYLYTPVNNSTRHSKVACCSVSKTEYSVITTVAVCSHIKPFKLLSSTLWIDTENHQMPFPVIFRSIEFWTLALWYLSIWTHVVKQAWSTFCVVRAPLATFGLHTGYMNLNTQKEQ